LQRFKLLHWVEEAYSINDSTLQLMIYS